MAIRDEMKIRLPTVAGQFYESNPLYLRRQLMELEAALAREAEPGSPAGSCILPHAGYLFSLRTAFATLRRAAKSGCRRVLLLSPTHQVAFQGAALSPYDAMRTPFGDLSVDRPAVDRLAALGLPELTIREDVHRHEHALEVQLPLLQYFFGSPEVLPLVCGRLTQEFTAVLSDLLASEMRPGTLLVCSSDFCHYGASFHYLPFRDDLPNRLRELDGGAIEQICRRDRAGFLAYCARTGITICGANVIALLLAILDRLDRRRTLAGELVDYTTSGELTGDYSHCVSYAGIAFPAPPGPTA